MASKSGRRSKGAKGSKSGKGAQKPIQSATSDPKKAPPAVTPADTLTESVLNEAVPTDATKVQEPAVSESAVSECAVSESAVPESAVPESAVLDDAVSLETASSETVSSDTVSLETVSLETVPSEILPSESLSSEAPPPEFIGDGLKDESAIDSPYAAPVEIAPSATSVTPKFAGLVRRSSALAFDVVLLALIDLGVIAYLLGRFAWDFVQPQGADLLDPFSDPEQVQLAVLVLGGLALFNWLYFTACEASPLRRTFGMAVFNARVMRLLPDGSLSTRVSFLRANLRLLGRLLTALTLGIGFVISLASARRQALQDRISSTVIVVE